MGYREKEYNLDTMEVNAIEIGMPSGIDLCTTCDTIPIINILSNKVLTSPEDVVNIYCDILDVRLNTEQKFKLSMLIKECYNSGYI